MNRTPVKKRRTGKPRRGPMRDAKYRNWVQKQHCIALTYDDGYDDLRDCDGGLFPEAAHTENNGMSSKGPDSSCVPLCCKHHVEYDRGRKAFEKKYGVDMKAIAAELYARYKEENG